MRPFRRPLFPLLAAALATSLGATVLFAQPGPPPDAEPGGASLGSGSDESPEVMRGRLRERIRIMRAWRLTEVIPLDEVTAVRLFEHLDAYDERIQAEQDTLAELGRQLREQLAATTTDDAAIRELVEQITATHLRIEELRVELVREAGAFLDARQQAALMLFLPDFDRQIQQLVREARGPRARALRGAGDAGPPAERPRQRRRQPRRWMDFDAGD